MFTGIIKAVAKVKKAESKEGSFFLTIQRPRGWKLKAGDSISTDGVCLTVKKVSKNYYLIELMPETLEKTYFGKIIPQEVNLEKSLRLTDLLDGHLVMGHVDTVGKIIKVDKKGSSKVYSISFPNNFFHLVAPKGAIAVDGISLTVVRASRHRFTVWLVDYTIKHTTLGKKKVGDLVNLEFDILAKYLQKLLYARSPKSKL